MKLQGYPQRMIPNEFSLSYRIGTMLLLKGIGTIILLKGIGTIILLKGIGTIILLKGIGTLLQSKCSISISFQPDSEHLRNFKV